MPDADQAATAGTALVIPFFNEGERWHEGKLDQLSQMPGVRLLLVDDGSTDHTPDLIRDFCSTQRASSLALPGNRGKAEAVRAGLREVLGSTRSPIVGFLDADGAFGGDDIQRILDIAHSRLLQGWDAVWSSRVALSGRRIERHPSRHYIGRAVATVLSRAYPALPYDSQSGFKVFARSPALEQVLQTPFETRWVFEVEMLLRWQLLTGVPMNVWEEPVLEWRDVPGSKIRGRESLRISRELGRVLRISRRPKL